MVGQSYDHVERNAHVCRYGDVIEHKRTVECVGQVVIVGVHLLGRELIVGGHRGGHHIGTGLKEAVSLHVLFGHTVACECRIHRNASGGSLGSRRHQQHGIVLAHRLALACGAHQQRMNAFLGQHVNDSLHGSHVQLPIVGHGCHHRHHHTFVFLLSHDVLFL